MDIRADKASLRSSIDLMSEKRSIDLPASWTWVCTQCSFRLNDVLAFVASTGNNSIYLAIADNCVDGFRLIMGSPANYTNTYVYTYGLAGKSDQNVIAACA